MNTIINNKDGRRSAAWTGLFVLSLLAAIVLVAPTGVFAQITGQLSQDCDSALVGNEHTITATLTGADVPFTEVVGYFRVDDPTGVDPYMLIVHFDENGIAIFPHTVSTVRDVAVTFFTQDEYFNPIPLDTITTHWTDNALDPDLASCLDEDKPAPPSVKVGGRVTLNAKKKGALTIAVCGSADLDVNNVDINSVTLVGVAPFHWKQKDSRLCPDGKDGFVDLEFKFKNREVVEALGPDLEDGHPAKLALTGNLNDPNRTAFGGDWDAIIKKEGKKHWKKSHSNSKENNGKGKGPK
jgi:hypothetical protein